MPTPTNERSEVLTNEVSPERDEELEKLIQMETEGCKMACRMIWRISARRATKDVEDRIKTAEVNARDKAIEECVQSINFPNCPPQSTTHSNMLSWVMNQLHKLKSQPQ